MYLYLDNCLLKMSISYFQFIEKYQLVPKNLRVKFLDFLSHFSYTIITDDEYGVADDLITVLYLYERTYHDVENYLELGWALHDKVCGWDSSVYAQVIESLLRQLKWYQKPITIEDVAKFRHKMVMKDILERVAYRPGNPGYERTMAHYISLCR